MRWLIACVLAVTSSFASAEGPLYGEVHLAVSGVQHPNLDFFPIFGSVTVGAFVMPGIGLEVFADTNLQSDERSGFDFEVEHAFGIAARFQSPPVSGVQGFITLGWVNFSVEQRALGTPTLAASSVSEDFTGARVSIGLMQRLQSFRNFLVTVEYRHYNADDPLRVDAVLLGLRVNTP